MNDPTAIGVTLHALPIPSNTTSVVERLRGELGPPHRVFAVAVGSALTEVINQVFAQAAGVELVAKYMPADLAIANRSGRIEGMQAVWSEAGKSGSPPRALGETEALKMLQFPDPAVAQMLAEVGRGIRDRGMRHLAQAFLVMQAKLAAAERVSAGALGIPLLDLLKEHAPIGWIHVLALQEGEWAALSRELETHARQAGLSAEGLEGQLVAQLQELWARITA